MPKRASNTLYLFVDESGNMDFSPGGTQYFLLSCLSTYHPVTERDRLLRLKYDLLRKGTDQEYFHATEDAQATRDEVFDVIKSLNDDFEIHAIIAQKNKANPSLYREQYTKRGHKITRVVGAEFYQRLCRTLLGYVFRRSDFMRAEEIVVVLGALFTRDKQSLTLKTLKSYLKERFTKHFEIYFHQAKSDLNRN